MSAFDVPSLQEAGISPTGVTYSPQVWGPVIEPQGPDVLTTGSDINTAANGPWPGLLASLAGLWTTWVRNAFHDFLPVKVGANYGLQGSAAQYNWRGYEFPIGGEFGSLASYPGTVPDPYAPEYNVLTPVVWGLQVLTPENNAVINLNPQTVVNVQNTSAQFVPGGTAALGISNPTLL